MKVPPLSERPDTEEEEQDFLTPPARRRSALANGDAEARGQSVLGSLCWWLASVAAYTLGAGIASWNEKPRDPHGISSTRTNRVD